MTTMCTDCVSVIVGNLQIIKATKRIFLTFNVIHILQDKGDLTVNNVVTIVIIIITSLIEIIIVIIIIIIVERRRRTTTIKTLT